MSTSSDEVAVPDPADLKAEAARKLVELFVDGDDATRQAIANVHGDRARNRR